MPLSRSIFFFFFFFNDTATTEIYTLSLHDALPIWWAYAGRMVCAGLAGGLHLHGPGRGLGLPADRGAAGADGAAGQPPGGRRPDADHTHHAQGRGGRSAEGAEPAQREPAVHRARCARGKRQDADRKSTRLNSSHSQISYAVFCLKK